LGRRRRWAVTTLAGQTLPDTLLLCTIPCPTLPLHIQPAKNSVSQKSDGVITKPTKSNEESEVSELFAGCRYNLTLLVFSHHGWQRGLPTRSHGAQMTSSRDLPGAEADAQALSGSRIPASNQSLGNQCRPTENRRYQVVNS